MVTSLGVARMVDATAMMGVCVARMVDATAMMGVLGWGGGDGNVP